MGVFEPAAFADSYDAVYGESLTPIGARLEFRPGRRWFLALATDFLEATGETVAFVPEPIPTGIETTLELNPWHLTAARLFRAESRLQPFLGAGVTALAWKERDEFEQHAATDIGGHAVAGMRWRLGAAPLVLDGEALYYLVPGALGDTSGAAEVLGEEDLGGLTVGLNLSWEF